MVRRPHFRASRRARRWTLLHRLAGLLVAIAVVSGLAQARLQYFHCEALGLSFADPCARNAQDRPPCPIDAFEADQRDCCERITMPAMPDAAGPERVVVPPAGVVATLPPISDWVDARMQQARAFVSLHGRSRASPPPPSERRAVLMVFLT